MKKVESFVRVMVVLAVMGCIFYLSSQTATVSRAFSNQLVDPLKSFIQSARWLTPSIREAYLSQPTVWTRKLAHFMIYLVLGIVSYWALPSTWSMKKRSLCVISLCVLYAITDEIHQSFVPGRGPEVRDVLIDTLGSSVGLGIGCFVKECKKHCAKNDKNYRK